MPIIGSNYQPELYDLVLYSHNYGKQPLVGEENAFLTAFLSFVMGRGAVLVKAFSGTGKTVLMNIIMSLIPENKKYGIELGSEKSPWYQTIEINQSEFVEVPELQKAVTNIDMVEILKNWGEGKAAKRKKTDIIIDATIDQILNPKPFITSVAMENRDAKIDNMEEFLRRVVKIPTDPSVQMTERVIKYKLQEWSAPGSMKTMDMDGLKRIRSFIAGSLGEREKLDGFINPSANVLFDSIPRAFTISRSYIDYLRRLINSIALFYKNERIIDNKWLFVSPEDIWMGWEIYGMQFIESCLKVPILGDIIIPLFPPVDDGIADKGNSLTGAEVTSALKGQGYNLEKYNVRRILSSLVQSGYIDVLQDSKPFRYFKSPFILEIASLDIDAVMKESESVMSEQYEEHYRSYSERYLDGGTDVIHPINGKRVNILKYKGQHKEHIEAVRPRQVPKKRIYLSRFE